MRLGLFIYYLRDKAAIMKAFSSTVFSFFWSEEQKKDFFIDSINVSCQAHIYKMSKEK